MRGSSIPFNQHVHRFVVFRPKRLPVVTATAVLDGTLPADHDLATGLPLHALLRVASWPNDGPKEVVPGVFVHRYDELAPTSLRHLWLERVEKFRALLLETLAPPSLAAVDTLANSVKYRLR